MKVWNRKITRERRLRGEIPDAVEVDVRLTHAVEKVFERLCSPPPVQYLDKLYGELEKLGGFIANPKNIDSPFINSGFLMKYGIDRNSPDEIRRQQAEKAYKELYARFEIHGRPEAPKQKGRHHYPKGMPEASLQRQAFRESPHSGQS